MIKINLFSIYVATLILVTILKLAGYSSISWIVLLAVSSPLILALVMIVTAGIILGVVAHAESQLTNVPTNQVIDRYKGMMEQKAKKLIDKQKELKS